MPSDQRSIRERAAELGIATGFWDGAGRRHEVTEDTLRVLLDAVGAAADPDPGWPPVLVCQHGRAHSWRPPDGERVQVVLESGERRELPAALPGDLPPGYHRLTGETGQSSLIVAPGRCFLPPALAAGGRAWGWTAQLYAVRSAASWGTGDLADLAALTGDPAVGGDFALISPLTEPTSPAEPGPYRPSSRIFRNPLYLSVDQVPERAALTGHALTRFGLLAAAGRDLTGPGLIDWPAVYQVKDEALRLCYAALDQLPGRRVEFAAWLASHPMAAQFGTFRALQRACGPDWRTWPSGYRHPDGAGIGRFRAWHADEVSYQAWLQWLVEAQLGALPAARVGVISDFPVGLAGGGFDAWRFQDQLATGVRIGAPPDAFAPDGQNWGLVTFAPARLRASGYLPFIQSVRAAMTGAGGLRIDHVMGLFRLFLIPAGADPADGTYLRLPADDLLGILALESHRGRALVVGEDLGNVEPGVRERLAAASVLSSRLVWFESDPADPAAPRRAADYPRLAMATVASHDLPTVAGFWTGADLRHQRDLGLIPAAEFEPARQAAERFRRRLLRLLRAEGLLPGACLPPDPDLPPEAGLAAVLAALHAFLARTPAMLVGVRLEDALEVPERPNVPGTTTRQRPQNWRLPLPELLAEIRADPRVQGISATLGTLLHAAAEAGQEHSPGAAAVRGRHLDQGHRALPQPDGGDA